VSSDRAVTLQILNKGQFLARVVANLFRPDLLAAGIDDGRHAFDLLIPGGLSIFERHVIQITDVENGDELRGSPFVIEPVDSFDDDLEAALLRASAAASGYDERERMLTFLAGVTDDLCLRMATDDAGHHERLQYQRLLRQLGAPPPDGRKPAQRALIIDDQLPATGRDAGSQAVLSHMTALQALGFNVSLVAANGVADSASGFQDDAVQVWKRPFYHSVEDVLSRQIDGFDVVYLHRVGIASRYLALARHYQPRAKIIYNVADLHHLRVERQAKIEERPELLPVSRVLQLQECTAAWMADAVLTHSSHEVLLLQSMVPQAKIYQVPWAFSVRRRTIPFTQRRGIAFIGHYRHEPNIDAVRWLVDDVMPLVWRVKPDMECFLVGADMPAFLAQSFGPRVHVTGRLGDLGGEILDRVRMTVAPLRFGAGVKGKVLESMASGVPCVMTSVAAEGINFPEAMREMTADTPAAFARAILSLYDDEKKNRNLGEVGRMFVEDCFNDDVVADALNRALMSRV